jgi:hypothetical protein
VDLEDPRDDGNLAQRVPAGCGKPQLRRGVVSGGPSAATEVGILRLIRKRKNILKYSGHWNFVIRKAGTDGEPICGHVAMAGND